MDSYIPLLNTFFLVWCVCSLQVELCIMLCCICMANHSNTISDESFKIYYTTVSSKNVFFASVTGTSYVVSRMQNLDASNELILCYASKMIVCEWWSWSFSSGILEGGKYWCELLLLWAEIGASSVSFKYIFVWNQSNSSLCTGSCDSVSDGTVNTLPGVGNYLFLFYIFLSIVADKSYSEGIALFCICCNIFNYNLEYPVSKPKAENFKLFSELPEGYLWLCLGLFPLPIHPPGIQYSIIVNPPNSRLIETLSYILQCKVSISGQKCTSVFKLLVIFFNFWLYSRWALQASFVSHLSS